MNQRTLGQEIRLRRSRIGPQKQVAHEMGISVRQLSDLERDKYVASSATQGELIRVLGFTTRELNTYMSQSGYALCGHEYVVARHDGNYLRFASELVTFDRDTIIPHPNPTERYRLTEEFTGKPENRAVSLWDQQGNWCVQTFNGELVGYWEFYALPEEIFSRLRSGEMQDGEISNSMLTPLLVPGRYFMYFNVITTAEGDHRKEGPVMNLLGSVAERLQGLARRGVFFSDICADAFSDRAEKLCAAIGMVREKKNLSAPEGFKAQIFYMNGRDIARGLFKHNEALVEAYETEFTD